MKKALVIGASSGIGRALAELLEEADYHVIITGRRVPLLQVIKAKNPEQFTVYSMDITDISSLPLQLEGIASEHGIIDLIIICSGIGNINKPLDTKIELDTLQTNVTGFTLAASWAFHYLKAGNKGQLAVITSVGGLRGSHAAPAYNASKAYQINYLEGLRKKIVKEKYSFHITDIRAGLVDTAMARGEGLFWVAPVDDAAAQIYKAIKGKRQIVYVTGRWRLIAWLLKILPRELYKRL